MGNVVNKFCNGFKCRSSCSLNDEIVERNQIQKILNNLNNDDLKELIEFHTLRKWIHKKEIEMVDNKLKKKYSHPSIHKMKIEKFIEENSSII